ncbi:MAG TPA: hypothetical protein VH741_10615, partial [Candidatus Limnocylindrales bacterium]
IARASGLLAFAMAFRLGARLAGPWAGAIAALALILSDEFIFNFVRGNSEGMLVALVLWAVERHLDGRFDHAFLLGFAASLLRPEVWPFWGLYGLWLLYRDRNVRTAALVFGTGAAAIVMWFLPEYLGSGDWLRAASRARDPNPDSAAFADSPFVEVFVRSAAILSVPVYVGAAIAVIVRRDRVTWALAAMATILMVAVALMTEAGFAGNLRYVALPAAFLCVLAGAGWVAVIKRWGAVAAVVVVAFWAPFVVADVDKLRYDWEVVEYEANFYGPNLKALIAKAGGEQRIKSCGKVFTGAFQVPVVAWRLHIHLNEAEIFPFGPGTALSMGATPLSVDPRYPEYTKTRHWLAGSTCVRR